MSALSANNLSGEAAKSRFIMIPRHKWEAVRELLGKGISYRKIARLVGVGRGTVLNIKKGRCVYERSLDETILYFDYFTHIYTRCPKCGWKVKEPCLKCQLSEI